VRVVRLNRPVRRNALSRQAAGDLVAVLDEADGDDTVRAVVVTGSGPAFCVGAELSPRNAGQDSPGAEGDRAGPTSDPNRDYGGIVALRLFALNKPVLAAINGDAVGLGVTMTLPMDQRIATPEARFGFVFARRGIVPEACSTWFLPRVVGINTALEWAMSGRLISAQEALSAGLLKDVVPGERLVDSVVERALHLVEHGAPVSVAATRRMLWNGLGLAHPMLAHRVESDLIRGLAGGPDAHEGIGAFLEKRRARFPTPLSEGVEAYGHHWASPSF
jgi:enoyl-CoA hydratase/carnithine racemase